jgi:hypothetical protein
MGCLGRPNHFFGMRAMFHGIPDGVDQKKIVTENHFKKSTVGFFFVQWPEVQLAFFCPLLMCDSIGDFYRKNIFDHG